MPSNRPNTERSTAQESRLADNPNIRSTAPKDANSWKAFEDAHRVFADALKEVSLPEKSRKQLAEAYSKYIQAVLESSGPADAKKLQDAYNTYIQLQEEISSPQAVKDRLGEVFDRYVNGIKTAWTQVEVKQVDAVLLYALGHSLMSVAQCSLPVLSSHEHTTQRLQ